MIIESIPLVSGRDIVSGRGTVDADQEGRGEQKDWREVSHSDRCRVLPNNKSVKRRGGNNVTKSSLVRDRRSILVSWVCRWGVGVN